MPSGASAESWARLCSNQAASSPGWGRIEPASITVEASTSVMSMSSCSSGCPVRLDHDCEMAFIRFWRTARERPAAVDEGGVGVGLASGVVHAGGHVEDDDVHE